jgi:hypothetical protein
MRRFGLSKDTDTRSRIPFPSTCDDPAVRPRPKPVVWKPRYATRRMREQAWARADLARERATQAGPQRSSLRARLARFLRRA